MCTMPYLCCRCCYSTVIFAFLPIPYPRLIYHILINPFTYAITTGIQSSLARTGWRNASHLKWYNLDHNLSHPFSFVNFHHLFHKVFCVHKFSPILSTLFSHPSHFLFFTFWLGMNYITQTINSTNPIPVVHFNISLSTNGKSKIYVKNSKNLGIICSWKDWLQDPHERI